ncbi:sushi, von Willebrand factor type A, EGF and pentraxin domain-containing protein 1-like [Dreissena polymorpha]|uniref:Tyrosine-protein kinase ephrin type A/B receptor-like domain-containing protein n=1 Tax=Dreissena polymorpha TaxID=45954 RepID=A0A9D4J5I7_DREPO|nr:sushi, von Willebrand factor type A, EGF and pentraxin domain-containing protein 1-like [Dreissena polymorpha]KAH3796102.1 hypothetical protein DPMN_149669 [Dreissena polymorpha]
MMAGNKVSRRKGNTELVGFEVEISCIPVKDPRSCYNILEEAYYTLQRLVNESRFSILVDHTRYDIVSNGSSVDGEVSCPPGTVEIDFFCVQCGPGSYPVDYYCERCPRGTYKEDFTSPQCTPCPSGWTTNGLQTRNASMCIVQLSRPEEHGQVGIVTVSCAGAITLELAVLVYCCMQRCKHARRHPTKENNTAEVLEIPIALNSGRLVTADAPTRFLQVSHNSPGQPQHNSEWKRMADLLPDGSYIYNPSRYWDSAKASFISLMGSARTSMTVRR